VQSYWTRVLAGALLGVSLFGAAALAVIAVLSMLFGGVPDGSDLLGTMGAAAGAVGVAMSHVLPIGSRFLDSGNTVPCLLGTKGCWPMPDSVAASGLRDLMAAVLEPGGFLLAIGAVATVSFLLGRITGRHGR
jgi:hypothetical protein